MKEAKYIKVGTLYSIPVFVKGCKHDAEKVEEFIYSRLEVSLKEYPLEEMWKTWTIKWVKELLNNNKLKEKDL